MRGALPSVRGFFEGAGWLDDCCFRFLEEFSVGMTERLEMDDGCDVVDIKIEMQIQGLQLLIELWVWCLVLHEAALALYRH